VHDVYFVDMKGEMMTNMLRMIGFLTAIIFFLMPGAGFSWPVPDTDQTACYDNSVEIPCPLPGEDFYGQDASYTINPISYTKLDASGNDLPDSAASWTMVRDNVTGLIWEVKQNKDGVKSYTNTHDADNTCTWYDPNPETNGDISGTPGDGTDTKDFIDALNAANYGGYNDWRLPAISELASLFLFSESETAINTFYFPNTRMNWYWSSTTFAGNNSEAWRGAFNYGFGMNGGKDNLSYVRAVRGGKTQSFFVDNGDSTVTDTATGLMWQKATAPGAYTWEGALDCCETLTLAGHSDWRLPTIKELRHLADWSQYGPAIDGNFFPDTQPSYYWSSMTIPGYPYGAWCMDFYDANEYGIEKNSTCHVRAVRSGQSGILDHWVISSPKQSSVWETGAIMPIRWEPAGLGNHVKISLSRQGGVNGSFSPIIETTPNDGLYNWTAAGSTSVNCVMKIEQADNPAHWASEGLFSINAASISSILSVSPISREVSKEAGTTTFSVSNTGTGTMNWTAAVISGGDWLSIESGANGTNAGTITCAFDAGSGIPARIGTIRVTASGAGGSPKDVTVIQEEAFQGPNLVDINKGLQVLAGRNVDIGDSLVDANRDGKVEMADALLNLVKFFSYVGPKSYEVNASGQIEFADDISGAVIIFPEGGSGTLTVAQIATAPDVDPFEGNLFLIEFTGDDDLQISYPRSDEEEPLVWIYGRPTAPIDFSVDKEAQWMPLPPQSMTSMPAIFDLYDPGEPIDETAAISINAKSPKGRPAHSYNVYYQNALKYNNWAWKRILVLWDITQKTIADIWNILPASVQAQKQSDYTSGLKPKGAYSGWSSGYIAFRYLGGLIRTRNPHFWYGVYTDSADEAVAAHESGHYISHLIVGDDQYEKLQAQRIDPHDLANVHANRDMLEEYAFFGDYFKNGDLLYKKHNVVDATQFFKWKRAEKDHKNEQEVKPATYNWPNLEGFGCFFLARLHTDKSVIPSHVDLNDEEPIPVFELDFTTIYGYLAKGPLTVNELYDYVENSFTSDQKAKLAVMVEKMGWSYNGFGKIVDTDGEEVAGAMVENVSSYSGWPNYKNNGSAQTGTDGKFTINRVYPGKSKLRVYYNHSGGQYLNFKDVEIDVPKEDPTNVARDFKTIVVEKIENNDFNFSSAKVFINLEYPVFYYNETRYQGYELCMYANHNDVGWVNFPSEQPKRFQGAISGNVFSGTCAASLSGPGTGQISITLSPDRTTIESFSLTFSNGYSDMNNFTIVSANAVGCGGNPIQRTYFMSGYKAEFQVTGNQHKYITELNYSIKCKDYPEKTYVLSYGESTQELLLIRFE